MLKNYTGKFGVIVDSTDKTIAIISFILFNETSTPRVATLFLKDVDGNIKSQIFETSLKSKETLSFDTKLFLMPGDKITGDGATFTISGDEE